MPYTKELSSPTSWQLPTPPGTHGHTWAHNCTQLYAMTCNMFPHTPRPTISTAGSCAHNHIRCESLHNTCTACACSLVLRHQVTQINYYCLHGSVTAEHPIKEPHTQQLKFWSVVRLPFQKPACPSALSPCFHTTLPNIQDHAEQLAQDVTNAPVVCVMSWVSLSEHCRHHSL